MPLVRIVEEAFQPWSLLAELEPELGLRPGGVGATAVFAGTMRDFNEGDTVQGMTLEHYPGMTERHLERIIDEARERFGILDALIVHRVGPIRPAETIVLTAVWSAHRKAAFEANRFLMEELKHRAPFWKKEALSDGSSRWVEQNTPG
ncbi:MAG: molybdenum cofactor biosynthesis protein MoaE [Gammaproteobacteria bacterium]|nr:MAG: molybdenum cofactor biosynthesis protein MoaE [Gammaproteobacteria bacterium]